MDMMGYDVDNGIYQYGYNQVEDGYSMVRNGTCSQQRMVRNHVSPVLPVGFERVSGTHVHPCSHTHNHVKELFRRWAQNIELVST